MTRTIETGHERNEETEQLFLNLMGPDATPEDWDRHQYLVRTSAEHRRVFAECERIWQRLDQIGAARLSRAELAGAIKTGRAANADTLTVVQVERTADETVPPKVTIADLAIAHGRHAERRRPWAMAVLAFAALVIVGLGVLSVVDNTPEELSYVTLTGEHKDIELPDGSRLLLGARSSVAVRYTGSTRLIELESGELLATVSPDDGRPFILVTDDMMVMATGTAFNMRNGSEYSTVSVVEGSVRVVSRLGEENAVSQRPDSADFDSGTPLRYGQQLRAATNAELGSVMDVDIERVTSWQSGQLYFLEDDLSTVFEDVMRYSDVNFRLTDDTLRERVYTGSFRPDSLEAWLDAIERAYSLKVTRISTDWIAIEPTDPL